MQIHELLERLNRAGLNPTFQEPTDENILHRTIGHLAHDSREVRKGGCFVAIRGGSTDGHLFIDKAVQQGALLVLCEVPPAEATELHGRALILQVADSRAALAEAAALYYGDPSRELRMIGITGTNGKTTTSQLVHYALQSLGKKTGLIGTTGVRIGTEERSSSLTTPDPIVLQKTLRMIVDAGCGFCVMEVSSHALAQQRVRGVRYEVAVFTNLSQDHLDYHGSMHSYLGAKKLLFDGLSEDAKAVYNCDDPAGVRLVADTPAEVQSYGTREGATYRIVVEENTLDGLHLVINGEHRRFNLVGRFNAYNLAATFATSRALGFPSAVVLQVLEDAPAVAGRFEQLTAPDGLRIIVDYAHTPAALENVLETIREATSTGTRIWCVFGCGGDRDRDKRPKMGRIAEELADEIVITSDNPRSEDPHAIIADIRRGLKNPHAPCYEADRSRAIDLAVERAQPDDVVLVAGKGHESYQIIGAEEKPFDDREKAKQALKQRTPDTI